MLIRNGRIVFVVMTLMIIGTTSWADLNSYLQKPDSSYTWSKTSDQELASGRVVEINFTSQTWESIPWNHRLVVIYPKKIEYPGVVTLFITGGSGGPEEVKVGQYLSNSTGIPVAILFNIPNQPLFGGKNEDALIAYTFQKYMETGDQDWPVLFPMTKSAIRAMDTLEAFSREDKASPYTRFFVAGASKRGWTTWLTAASGDKRIIGIIPMVYDNLNLAAQMPHQLESWGDYSIMIKDYTKLGIQSKMNTDRGKELIGMVDPYSYRDKLTMPKLIVNGSNDPYWTQDSLNLYWNELKGPKWVHYAVNSGHGLESRLPLLQASSVFITQVAAGSMPPAANWKWTSNKSGMHLEITGNIRPSAAKVWTAVSTTKDFRKSVWTSIPMKRSAKGWNANIHIPATGFIAAFGQTDFLVDGKPFPVCTQVEIAGAK